MATTTMDEQREQKVLGLRALADALEANPEMPLPMTDLSVFPQLEVKGDETTLRATQRILRAIPGKVSKESLATWMQFTREFGGGVRYQVQTPRDEVCTRRQTGTKEIEEVVPVETRTETREVPVYEWDCEPVLADREAVA